jgi:hypothetical protein
MSSPWLIHKRRLALDLRGAAITASKSPPGKTRILPANLGTLSARAFAKRRDVGVIYDDGLFGSA